MMKTEKMRKAAKEITRALRCISTVQDRARDCAACRYWRKETLDAWYREKLGVDEWASCDIDRIGLDAAELLEGLAEAMG